MARKAKRPTVVRLRRIVASTRRVGLDRPQPKRTKSLDRRVEQLCRDAVAAVRRGDDEAGDGTDSLVVGCLQPELVHHARQARRLAVVAPAHRPAVRKRQEPGHLALPDELAHVAPVVIAAARRPFRIVLRAVRLHAVAELPGGKVSKRVLVEEELVLGYQLGRHVTHLDRADF
jgi:hypothetical protein